jgi:hypothetical protein
LSAAGQDEQPCEVNNSTTARGPAAVAVAGATTTGRIKTKVAPISDAPDQCPNPFRFVIASHVGS